MRKSLGFSIIELLAAIAVVVIFVSIGIPSWINYRQKVQLAKASRDIYARLQRTKMEATRNNRFCVFSFSERTVNGATYSYHVFVDESNPHNFVYDDGVDTFISGYRSKDFPNVQVDNNFGGGDGITFPDVAGAPAIAFAPDGRPKNLDGTLSGGSLYVNAGSGNGRQISVSQAGDIQITKYKANLK